MLAKLPHLSTVPAATPLTTAITGLPVAVDAAIMDNAGPVLASDPVTQDFVGGNMASMGHVRPRHLMAPLVGLFQRLAGSPSGKPNERLISALADNERLKTVHFITSKYLLRQGIDMLSLSLEAQKNDNGGLTAAARFTANGTSIVLSEEYFTGETDHTVTEVSEFIILNVLAQKKSDPMTNCYCANIRTRLPAGLTQEMIVKALTSHSPMDPAKVDTPRDVFAAIRTYSLSAADGYVLSCLNSHFTPLEAARDGALSNTFEMLAPHLRALADIIGFAGESAEYKDALIAKMGARFLDEATAVVEEARRRGIFEAGSTAAKALRPAHHELRVYYEEVAKVKGLPSPPAFEGIASAEKRAERYFERSAPIREALPEIIAKLERENAAAQAAGFETAYDYFLKMNYGFEHQAMKREAELFLGKSEKDMDEFMAGIRTALGTPNAVHPWDIEFAVNKWMLAEAEITRAHTISLKAALNIVAKFIKRRFDVDIFDPKYGILFDLAKEPRHATATTSAASVSQTSFWKAAIANMDPNAVTLKDISSIAHEIAGHILHSILTQENLQRAGEPDSVLGIIRNPIFSETYSVLAQGFLREMTADLGGAGFSVKYLQAYDKVTRLYDIFRQRRSALWAISERILYDNKNFPTAEEKEREMDRLQKKWLKTSPAPGYGYWLSEFYSWHLVGRYWLGMTTPIYGEKIKKLAESEGVKVEAFLRPYLEGGGEAGMELIR